MDNHRSLALAKYSVVCMLYGETGDMNEAANENRIKMRSVIQFTGCRDEQQSSAENVLFD